MSSPRYVVGIDCGTQSAKVIVADAGGRIVASGREPLQPMVRPRHGIVQHPGDDLWHAIGAATREAMAGFGGDPASIAAVGICPIRCCKAFMAENGTLVEPLMSWMDERAYRPYLPADPRLRWATTASGYIAHRCTGLARDTAANCIDLQWPIDPLTWQWSDDPSDYERHGVDRDLLVELQMPGDVIGPLTAAAAHWTGLAVGTPVVHTANDKAVEMLGAGVIGERTVLVSLGTYIAAMVPGREYRHDAQRFWTNFSAVPGRYVYESGGIRRGMWTLSWFLDLLGPELAERAADLGVTREEYLEREASLVPVGSDGLLTVLDWLAPGDRPARRGSMLGFDARHTRGHMYRSILEAIALSMRDHVDAMCAELGVEVDEVVVSGGGSTSPLVLRIMAAVFDRPASAATGGAAMGAAMCAAAAAGLHVDVESAAMAMASPRHAVEPHTDAVARYRELLAVHRDIRDHTDPHYERAEHLSR